MKKYIGLIVISFMTLFSFSQQLVWTGDAGDNEFFNESNWQDTNTNLPPVSGTLDPGTSIDLDLQVQNNLQPINASGILNLGTGSLSISSSSLSADVISGGNVEINQDGYIELNSNNPFQNNVAINFNSGMGWIRTLNLKGSEIEFNHINQISVNQQPAIYESNLRLDNYYLDGTVIRSNDLGTAPVTIYANADLQGNSANLSVDIIHTGNAIANNLNNQVESFILKKGYMVTMADNEDGTGRSKNYIASESDLIINALPSYLADSVSFIRVLPWNWVSKKGIGGTVDGLDNTWRYLWNNTGSSALDEEYAPMAWGYGGANDDADIELYRSKYKATHVMAFNESDNCNDQSGQYNNLCDTDVAISIYENLMKTGLRLVSPSCRENAPFGWLKEFHDKANAQDIRIDVIAVHWYDWASNPQNSPNADPNAVFNRFVTYLQNVHDLYNLPIWITEFNANPNRSNSTNHGFMQLALPYLESLDYVERYAWFQPNSGVADYYDTSGTTLTNVGTFYKNQVSTPSIPEATVSEDSNLDMYYNVMDPTGNNILINGFFETGDLTGWSGSNIDILTNAYEGTTAGRIKANPGSLYQIVNVEPLADYNLSFYTKWFVSPSGPIAIKILNATTEAVIASQMMTTSTDWNFVELDFTVPAGVNSIKVIVEKGSEPGWFIDNAVLLKTETLGIDELDIAANIIYPNPSNGVFNLKSENPIESYAVYNIQGQLIQSKTSIQTSQTQINLAHQKIGVYILSIKYSNGNQSSKKLVIKG